MRHYLTPAFVKGAQCPPGKRFEIYWDGDGPKAVTGFGLKLMASGARSYVCQYHRDGRDSRVTLDGAVRLADARKWAKGVLGDVGTRSGGGTSQGAGGGQGRGREHGQGRCRIVSQNRGQEVTTQHTSAASANTRTPHLWPAGRHGD